VTVFPNEFDDRTQPSGAAVLRCQSYVGRTFEERSTVETIGLGGAGSIQSESGSQSNHRKVDTGTTVVDEFDGSNG
jgi:hypothetical protein